MTLLLVLDKDDFARTRDCPLDYEISEGATGKTVLKLTEGWQVFSLTSSSLLQLRDYLHEHLYGKLQGYFNQARPPIAPLDKPLNFHSFLGKADYLSAVAEAHESLNVGDLHDGLLDIHLQ